MKKSKKIIAVIAAIFACLTAAVIVFSPDADAKAVKAEINKIYCTNSGIKLSWQKVDDVAHYTVYRMTDGTNQWKKVKKLKGSSFVDKGLVSGQKYTYKIETGSDVFGKEVSFTYIAAPKMKTAKRVSTGVNVKWTKVKAADGYKIYRRTPGGSYKRIAQVNSTTFSYTDAKAKNGVTYEYAVRAVAKDGSKSTYSENPLKGIFLAVPKDLSVRNSPNGVTVSWKKTKAPEAIEILRKTSGGEWKKVGTVTSDKNSFIDKKAPYGKKVSYRIRAVSGQSASYYAKKQTVFALDPNKPAIALTFDDGPYSPVTNQILDCLESNNAHATFFVVGSRVTTYKDCIKRASALDCEIGCHTYNHAILTRLSAKEIKKEISSAVSVIEKYSGKKVRLVRTPGGAVNDTVRANVNYPLVNWSIDTLDWQHRTTSKTVEKVKANAFDGAIVLMHDLYYPTGDAAVELIPWLKAQGYQLVTVSELFELKGITPKNGSLYTRG